MELDLEPYRDLWTTLNINTLEQMDEFIGRPSMMYRGIMGLIMKVKPSFPTEPYYKIQFEEDVDKIVTDLK
jgi:hypothetical protein